MERRLSVRSGAVLAGRQGFEPWEDLYRPQSLSRRPHSTTLAPSHGAIEAEREGFEPPELSLNCFQDSRLKPLGHLSAHGPGHERTRSPIHRRRQNGRHPTDRRIAARVCSGDYTGWSVRHQRNSGPTSSCVGRYFGHVIRSEAKDLSRHTTSNGRTDGEIPR